VTEKTIKINWKGKQEDVTIKSFTFGEQNDISEQATVVDTTVRPAKVSFSQKKLIETTMLKGITKAPFPITLEGIQNLDAATGTHIYEQINKINQSPGKMEKSA